MNKTYYYENFLSFFTNKIPYNEFVSNIYNGNDNEKLKILELILQPLKGFARSLIYEMRHLSIEDQDFLVKNIQKTIFEEINRTMTGEQKITLEFIGIDDFGRPVFIGSNDRVYKSVELKTENVELSTIRTTACFDCEPDTPINPKKFVIA